MSTRLLAVVLVSALLGLALGRAALAPATATAPAYVTRIEMIMATPILVEATADEIDRAAAIVFATFHEVDARMSEWKESSPLSAVNRLAGVAPAPVPDDLREVVRRGVEIGDLTGGAFDVTWAALWGLWDFNAESPAPPPDAAIEARLPLVDYRRVRIDDARGEVFLPRAGMLIGLGGIAKGYALDQAAERLRSAGIGSFLLSAGGQVLVGEGRAGAEARPWRVGIRDPRGGPTDEFARLDLVNTSISTSGDYERYFVWGGERYHHVLDPRTGRPARGVRAATVVTPDATLADALSTSLMVMGVERGLALVERLENVEALMIDGEGRVHLSRGLAGRLEGERTPRREGGG